MKEIIECSNINKHYKNNVIVVNNVSFKFEDSKFYSIMGHSGSGKTTLLQILGLLNNYTDGELRINNIDTKELSNSQKADIRRDIIGFVFQSYFLNKNMKAYENVMIPMLIKPSIKDKKEKAICLLKQFGLEDRINHYPEELSGGEQQRVAIARALANDPLCILADEPTGNLDKENELIVLDYRYINSDGSLSPRFSLIIEQIGKYMFVLLLAITQILFVIITIKKINIESVDFALLKCMGYKTKDILTIVGTQLFLISTLSFFISIILSVITINILNYYFQEYINIKFHFNTIMNQMIILIIEYVFVCMFTATKIRKINVTAAYSIF